MNGHTSVIRQTSFFCKPVTWLLIPVTGCFCGQESVTWMSYVSIACVIVYVIGHAIGASESDPPVLTCTHSDYNTLKSWMLFGWAQTCHHVFFCKLALSCSRHELCRCDAQRVMVYRERFGCGQPHRVLFRSHSQRGDHRDVQAVSPALRLHGWRLRPLAVQLHSRPRFPLHGGQFTHNSPGATVCYSHCNQLQMFLTA